MAEYQLPEDLQYTRDDEWIKPDGEGLYRIGITDYAQQQLGDIVFVELPSVGDTFDAGQPFGVIESVKAVSDLYSPMAIEIVEVNEGLEDTHTSVSRDLWASLGLKLRGAAHDLRLAVPRGKGLQSAALRAIQPPA